MNYFSITGASKGIGEAIAWQCAKKGLNLLLVARSEVLLKTLAEELMTAHNIEANYFAVDLTISDAVSSIFKYADEQQIKLTGCVNNAGLGTWGSFTKDNPKNFKTVNLLNIQSLVDITHTFLNKLPENKKGYLLNVASTAAYQPTPYMALYSASKAYVYSLTRALREELKHRNINITCLCPGPTKTDFADSEALGELDKINQKVAMSAEKVAKTAVRGLFKNEAVVIPGMSNFLGAKAAAIFPDNVVVPLVGSIFKKMER